MIKITIDYVFPQNTKRRELTQKLFRRIKEMHHDLSVRRGYITASPELINATTENFEVIMELFFKNTRLNSRDDSRMAFLELQKKYRRRGIAISEFYNDLNQLLPSGRSDAEYVKKTFPKVSSKKKLNILYITGMFPSIEHGGGLRLFDILLHLTACHNVDIYSVFDEDLDRKSYELIKDKFGYVCLTRKFEPYISDIAVWLKKIGRDNAYYDVIQLEYPTTISLIDRVRRYGKKVGFTFMESISKSSSIAVQNNVHNPKYLGDVLLNFVQDAKAEKYIAEKADFLIAMTPEDANFIFTLSGVTPYIIPTCVSEYVFKKSSRNTDAGAEYAAAYVGFFDHLPNVDAVVWYYQNVHYKVKKALPDYKILIIGRGNTERLQELTGDDDSVVYTGPVEDISDHITKARVCISPLISGAGIRGKINQYSFLGKPTVSTTIGLCGTPYIHNESVLRADDPVEFGDCMIRLLTDNTLYEKISKECRDVASRNFGWGPHITNLESLYQCEPDQLEQRGA